MGRTRLLIHGRVSATGGFFGVPIKQVDPYFVADPLTLGTPVSSVIVGQRQFIHPGVFSDSPTHYDWAVEDNATGTVIDSGTSMLAAGDDYWTPVDSLSGTIVRLEVTAYNGVGASIPASSTKLVQLPDLSLAAPVLTRSSASAASPFTVSQGAFASSVYENYAVQLVLATSNALEPDGTFAPASIVYDETVFIDADTISAPNSIVFPAFDDSGYGQLYEMRRILTRTPNETGFYSPWSNMAKKSDALTNVTNYDSYDIYVTDTPSGFYTLLARLEIAATPAGADTANNADVTHAASNSVGGAVANAFDGNSATYWATSFGGVAYPHTLTADYTGGTRIAANEFKLTCATGGGAAGFPRGFLIRGWLSGVPTTLKTLTGVTATDGEVKTYVL